MMKKVKYYSFSDLKESSLMYNRKPPLFGVIITFITVAFFALFLLLAIFSNKTYVVKANGVVSNESKINIMNSISGKITDILVEEGQEINKGDVLLTLDDSQVRLQINQLKSVKEFYERKIDEVGVLVSYVNGYQLEDETTWENPFDENDIESLKSFSIADNFYTSVKQQVNQSLQEGSVYNQSELDSIKIPFLTQQSVFAYLDEYSAQKIQQESQIEAYTKSLDEYVILSKIDGIVHLTSGITIGTFIQAGSLLGNISSENEEGCIINSIVNATERSKLQIGSNVEISLSGIIQTEFGTLKGRIISIDSDSSQTENGQVFYQVTIKPERTFLEDKKGNRINLKNGMVGECRIQYSETTWFNWIIEQIVGKTK